MKEEGLVQPVDSNALAQRSIELLRNPRQRASVSKSLRLLAESRFGAAQCAAAVHQCYQRVRDRPRQLDESPRADVSG